MAAKSINGLPLVVIVGPTASGKTKLAISLAQQFGGEIISADSRTVFTGMDIGTAKPTMIQRQNIPHWGFDLVEPNQRFSVASFKDYAQQKITEIRARGHIPFLVGGTGLYVDAIIFDYQFGPEPDAERRNELMQMTIEELHEYCYNNNIEIPENKQNKRYVVRAIEQKSVNHKRHQSPIPHTFIVGIATDKSVLRERIAERTEQLFEDGVVEEATMLGKKYGWESEAMTGNVYPLIRQLNQNAITLDDVKTRITTLDWRLAKRQLTWLRRNPHIIWASLSEAEQILQQKLANQSEA